MAFILTGVAAKAIAQDRLDVQRFEGWIQGLFGWEADFTGVWLYSDGSSSPNGFGVFLAPPHNHPDYVGREGQFFTAAHPNEIAQAEIDFPWLDFVRLASNLGSGAATHWRVVYVGSGAGNQLSVSPSSRSIEASGGSLTFSVTSNISWSWSKSASWVTSGEASPQSNNQTFSYTVAPNTSSSSRTATITLSGGGRTATHTITQAGTAPPSQLSVDPASRSATNDGGGFSFSVNSNLTWTWSSIAAWVTSAEPTTQSGTQTFSYTLAPNPGLTERTATITLSGGGLTATHTITQAAGTSGGGPRDPFLRIQPALRNVDKRGGPGAFLVESNQTWTWSVDVPWIESNEFSPQGNDQTFIFEVAPNTEIYPRVGTISLVSGNLSATHTVLQAGFDFRNSGVVAWGENGSGQTEVPPCLTNVVAVSAGGDQTIALREDGSIVSWGGTQSETFDTAALRGVVAISAGGQHALALKEDGTVVAWGRNDVGQASVPAGLVGVVAIAAGTFHSAALKRDGTVVAWGDGWETEESPLPRDVIGISSNFFHLVALRGNGTAGQWSRSYEPPIPFGLDEVASVSAGWGHSVARKIDGSLVIWGEVDSNLTLIPVDIGSVVSVDAGYRYTVSLRGDGRVVSWGPSAPPVPAGLSGVVAIDAGFYHAAAIIENHPPCRPNIKVRHGARTLTNKRSTLDFGRVRSRTSSRPIALTIHNSGTAPLVIHRLETKGGHSNEFQTTRPSQSSLRPNQSTKFLVKFRPMRPVASRTTLRIWSNDAKSGIFAVKLSGQGR